MFILLSSICLHEAVKHRAESGDVIESAAVPIARTDSRPQKSGLAKSVIGSTRVRSPHIEKWPLSLCSSSAVCRLISLRPG